MIIVLAPSVGGKSTLMRYLRDTTDLKIAEIDEELLASNNNVWPDSDLIHSKLIPEITRRMARSHYDIFFSKDTTAELVSEVKASGVKVVVLNLTISQLLARNTKRMCEEGYDDASPWLEGQLNQLKQLEDSSLVDASIDGNLSTEVIASQIISMLELNTDIEIKDSSLNGKGVFAKRLIKKGEVIFTWHPKVLTKEEASQLPEDELEHYTYPEGDTILWMQPPERYMNHSCEPNTKVDGKSDVAIRDIQPGDEITSDYIDIETENFVCNCGTNTCRGSSKKHNDSILDIPEYHVDGEPDFNVIGKKIDDYIKQEYLGRRLAIRALSSDEHSNLTRDKLIEIIKRNGSDRYDPSREGDRYKNVDNKHIDFFALPLDPLKTEDEMFGHMLDSFYHYPLKIRGKPVKVDIIIIYDLNQLDQVEHQYEGRDEIKKDGFVFKDQDRSSSILQVIKVN